MLLKIYENKQSLLNSKVAKKVVSPDTELSLPSIIISELHSVQTETVRLTGQVTLNVVEKLCTMGIILSSKGAQLKGDNAALKTELNGIEGLPDILSSLPST
jgi:hypothetical protein